MAAQDSTTADKTNVQDDLVIYGGTYRNTATKTALSAEETPQGYSVIDQEELTMRNADSVATALRYSTGVNTELRGGAVTRLDLFTIRGFINYQNSYDGLQLLFNDWNL
ncbi:MAG: TonB-dependent siderophore receptor, partial [Oceanospirillum sp.]|nr:TonB-dependent siderophore receptor [Oceanospirillum sp.]